MLINYLFCKVFKKILLNIISIGEVTMLINLVV
jgi:hypothetical protein